MKVKNLNSVGLAYDAFEDGHRRSYLETWSHELGFDMLIARPSIWTFIKLLTAPRVLFSTLDDVLVFFVIVGLARLLLGRKTVGLFLRPHSCFQTGHLKYKLKWLCFSFLRSLPLISQISIIPYFVNPRFSEVSRDWIYDPQNWDLAFNRPDITRRTDLVDRLASQAQGRKIIAAIGGLNRFKGFDYFGEIVASGVINPKTHFVIACGPLSQESKRAADAITNIGGVIIDRFITDDDIMAIYGVADLVWACYPKVNDQASGIFGRASQLGVPAIVRQGSFNALQAQRMGAPFLAVPFDDPARAAGMMISAQITRKLPDWAMIESFKAESLTRLRAYL